MALFSATRNHATVTEVGVAEWNRIFWAKAQNECGPDMLLALEESWGYIEDDRDEGKSPIEVLLAWGVEF